MLSSLAAWSAGSSARSEARHDGKAGCSGRSGNALIRGGYWNSESNAGAFNLNNDWPDNRNDNVGFR